MTALWAAFRASKLFQWGAIAAGVLAAVLFIRKDARDDLRRENKIEDLENAVEIDKRVADSRADPERLRQYDNSGWRDG